MSTKLPREKAALERAVRVLGGRAEMASLLGVKDHRTVWQYFQPDRRIPAEHCPLIERATRERGQPVLCEELRPDVAWSVVRGEKAKAR